MTNQTELTRVISQHEASLNSTVLICKCGWKHRREPGARQAHNEHVAKAIALALTTPPGSRDIADVTDLTYAATALEASSDAGDRYAARRLRNLADALVREALTPSPPTLPAPLKNSFPVGARVSDHMRRTGSVTGISKDGGKSRRVRWDVGGLETACPVSTLSTQCFYENVWTDEVGNIAVCQLHGNNSRHESLDPHRPCLSVDPYPPTT